MTEALDDLREFIAYRIRKGFESAHEIVENAHEWAYDRYKRDDLLREIKRLTAEALAAHRSEQIGWGATTDCDRLDEAFASLNAQGIVARQDFSCCNNCGFTEIWDEVEEAEKQGPVEGYVFYHLQCTEQAINTGRLLMAYGCVEDDPEAFQRVGNKIVAELRRGGLDASWGGTAGHPIVVDGMVWRRRRA
ncbi:MAG: hypothetical protein U0835_22685 [Isosphaeraceae bacterium]